MANNNQPVHAYLVNEFENKHFFIAVLMNSRDNDQWTVYTAWGYVDSSPVKGEKEYSGGRNGDKFSGQRNAEAYAKAIINTKGGDGYCLRSNRQVKGSAPLWWASVEANNPLYDGKTPAVKPAGLSAKDSPASRAARSISELKERMAAKVKIEAGKTKIAIKHSDTNLPEPKRIIQPRFGFVPRKP